jgi:NAD(P)-dependent dehydrogenase (short-subunit alcohol dehydrogenase family)
MSARVVLITGASKGLGRLLAEQFWEAGYSLNVLAREQSGLDNLRQNLADRGRQELLTFACDLSDTKSIEKFLCEFKEKNERLDVLINNAATHGPICDFLDADLTNWKSAFDVDFFAPVILCHSLLPIIIESGGGSIINLSGGGATSSRPRFSAYSSAKTALVRFTENLANEVGQYGIRANCIAPGPMKTGLLREVLTAGDAAGVVEIAAAEKVFAEQGSRMVDVAELALFLASDDSSQITGKLISAVWDKWKEWSSHTDEIASSDAYTLRRIVGRDRGFDWADK